MDLLFEILNQKASISQHDYELIIHISRKKVLKKGDFWLKAGMVGQEVAFVNKGYLRKYYLQDGKDVTDYFYLENSFTGDLPSIISQQATFAFVEAMESSELIVWNYDKLNVLAKKFHSMEHLLRKFTETGFLTFYNRTKSFITQTPKERYDALVKENPDIHHRVKQYHIASYLGITPQHLSRLRKQAPFINKCE